jgi:hypothetical protein
MAMLQKTRDFLVPTSKMAFSFEIWSLLNLKPAAHDSYVLSWQSLVPIGVSKIPPFWEVFVTRGKKSFKILPHTGGALCAAGLKAVFHFNQNVRKRSVCVCFHEPWRGSNDLETKKMLHHVTIRLNWKTPLNPNVCRQFPTQLCAEKIGTYTYKRVQTWYVMMYFHNNVSIFSKAYILQKCLSWHQKHNISFLKFFLYII